MFSPPFFLFSLVGSPELQAAVEDGDDEDTGDEIGPLSNANTPTDIEKEIFWKTPEKVCTSCTI